jgi:hypothetical protein|tara:strand:- start:140 stop:484 length:345 start_codon:yes stop_codon:yes gene_type:complete
MRESKLYNNEKRALVDIDETICFYKDKRIYELAIPQQEYINKINKLFDEGWYITYWTARGGHSNIDYYDLTEKQLKQWGCKYHDIVTGFSRDGNSTKPSFDLVIDDKAKRIEEL